jgi:hypothetical protein
MTDKNIILKKLKKNYFNIEIDFFKIIIIL